MTISENQIMKLMLFVHDYIKTLIMMKETNGLGLSNTGINNLSASAALMNEIYAQQSNKLIEVKNDNQ